MTANELRRRARELRLSHEALVSFEIAIAAGALKVAWQILKAYGGKNGSLRHYPRAYPPRR